MGQILMGDDVLRIREFTGACSLQVSDDMINFVVSVEESTIIRTCGMVFEGRTITEIFDGDGSDTLMLTNYPVSDLSVLIVDGTTILSTGYYLYKDKGMVRLRDGSFTFAGERSMFSETGYMNDEVDSYQNVLVTYTYGAPVMTDPDRFGLAKSIAFAQVCKKVLLQMGNVTSGGIVSEKMDEYSLSFGSGGPYSNTIDELNKQIDSAYKALGITVEAKVI